MERTIFIISTITRKSASPLCTSGPNKFCGLRPYVYVECRLYIVESFKIWFTRTGTSSFLKKRLSPKARPTAAAFPSGTSLKGGKMSENKSEQIHYAPNNIMVLKRDQVTFVIWLKWQAVAIYVHLFLKADTSFCVPHLVTLDTWLHYCKNHRLPSFVRTSLG